MGQPYVRTNRLHEPGPWQGRRDRRPDAVRPRDRTAVAGVPTANQYPPLQFARADQFDVFRQAYSAAVGSLDEAGRQYLEDVLLRLDTISVDQVRPAPTGLASIDSLRDEPIRKPNAVALHQLLRTAWGDTLVGLLAIDWSVVGVRARPTSNTVYLPRITHDTIYRQPSAITACEAVVKRAPRDSNGRRFVLADCSEGVANVWLMYQATGDDRFRKVAIGIQNIALTGLAMTNKHAGAAPEAKPYFRCLSYWLDPEQRGSCQSD